MPVEQHIALIQVMDRHGLGGGDQDSRDHYPTTTAETAEQSDDQAFEERQVAYRVGSG